MFKTQNHQFFFTSLISLNSHTLFSFVSLNSTTSHLQFPSFLHFLYFATATFSTFVSHSRLSFLSFHCCSPFFLSLSFLPLSLLHHHSLRSPLHSLALLRCFLPFNLSSPSMARTKQTGRRTAREVPPPLPCLSNYEEEDWFEEDSEKKAYSERLSRIHIIPPRYVGDGAIPEDKYSEFWRLIDVQGLRQFLLQREGYYPRFVAAAFASVVVDDNLGDEGLGSFIFCVSFMGRTFKFPVARIAEAWGLRNEGTIFRGGSNPHSEWSEFEKMDAARALRLDPASSGKYHVSRMTTTHRLLLYVISRILMPRKSNHGSATEEDLILLWAMINERQINWPYLMAYKLVEYSHGKVNSALGLPHLLGKVFPLIPLDVSQEEFVASKPEFAITSKNINQMRQDLDNPDEAERNVRPRTDVGSSSQAPREAGESS
ncbi:hypothetical protein PIB30_101094 [Stylosanthes scabra]|uniref:Uncharacterized protein n=1 Tax=Stylosanthes scabra TaxID=79078 RepID=A0ABU6ZVY9_9FABA|nr:hypothetical protein [Stylosanthes scabra]